MTVSINDPCPCGSGRKYKRCCLARQRIDRASERQRQATVAHDARAALDVFARERHGERLTRERDGVMDAALARYGEEKLGRLLAKAGEMLFHSITESILADERFGGGPTVLERFLAERGATLHPDGRRYLEAVGAASLALYEVEEVNPGDSMLLHDLLSRRRVEVRERSASKVMVRFDVLFARVAELEGSNQLTGGIYAIDRRFLGFLVDRLRGAKNERGRGLSWPRFLEREWRLIPELWLEAWLGGTRTLANTDGESVVPTILRLRLAPGGREQVGARLEAVPEIVKETDDDFAWVEAREGGPIDNVQIARITLAAGELTVEVNSRERAERLLGVLEPALGDLLAGIEREEHSLDEVLAGGGETGGAPPPGRELPAEARAEMAAIERRMRREYDRRWLDMTVPALGGATPREAASDPELRPHLVELLRQRDVQAARGDREEQEDAAALWRALGLRRR